MQTKTMSAFVEIMGNSSAAKVIDFLIHVRKDCSLAEIMQGANVAYATLRRIIEAMKNHDLIIEVSESGKRKKYRWNESSFAVKHLISFYSSLSENSLSKQASRVAETETATDAHGNKDSSSDNM